MPQQKMTALELVEALRASIADGKSKAQLAESCGYTVSTLSQNISAIRSKLKTGLEATGTFTPEQVSEKLNKTIPQFPRGKAAGSGTGGSAQTAANALLAEILAGSV